MCISRQGQCWYCSQSNKYRAILLYCLLSRLPLKQCTYLCKSIEIDLYHNAVQQLALILMKIILPGSRITILPMHGFRPVIKHIDVPQKERSLRRDPFPMVPKRPCRAILHLLVVGPRQRIRHPVALTTLDRHGC